MTKNKKIGVISLGCDKNRVDTEKMLYILSKQHILTNEIEQAEVIIINTCAFLKKSREEAITEILSSSVLKKSGKLEKLIVTGCLPQKFINEIFDELIEVDAFLGVSDYDKINDIIDELYEKNERINAVGVAGKECGKNRVLTTRNYAYLKIADGCNNHCTYCLIPKIRGKFRSVPKAQLVEEAKSLGEIDELILVAQDVTRYGEDLGDTYLCDLIRAITALKNIHGVRLLYVYPEGITDELIREFQGNSKLIRYIDMPLQHADDLILKKMNRKGTGEGYLKLIERLKNEVKGIAIRSTFIAGFPNETEEQFNNLVEFIKRAELFNAGFFAYSREEDTPAYKMDNQIKAVVKNRRVRKLYSTQKKVVKEINKSLVDNIFNVICEGFDDEKLCYVGRAYFNAPDIDGKVYFLSSEEVKCGDRVNVKITDFVDYDLYGEATNMLQK